MSIKFTFKYLIRLWYVFWGKNYQNEEMGNTNQIVNYAV